MQSHLKQTLVDATSEIADLCANGGCIEDVGRVIRTLPVRDRRLRIRKLARKVESASQELSLLAAEEASEA